MCLLKYEGEVYTMKKKITALLLTVLTVVSLTACGKPFTCDLCNQEKTGKKYTEKLFGEEITYCQDCYDSLKELSNGLQDLFN